MNELNKLFIEQCLEDRANINEKIRYDVSKFEDKMETPDEWMDLLKQDQELTRKFKQLLIKEK